MEPGDDGHGEARCECCGGLNDPSAEWCAQCFARFAPLPAPPAPADSSGRSLIEAAVDLLPSTRLMPTAEERSREGTLNQILEASDGRPTWICGDCKTKNPIELDRCSICGTSFKASARKVASAAARAEGIDRPGLLLSPAGLLSPLARLGPWGIVLAVFMSVVRLFARRRR